MTEDPERELARLRELLGSVEAALWLRDLKEERLLYLSPGFEKIWGRPAAEIVANPRLWLESVHPDDRARVLSAAVSAARSGEDHIEYRIVRPDGSVRRVHDRSYPVRDAQGRIVRLAGLVEDVTDRP